MKFSDHKNIQFLTLDECSTALWHQILRLRSDVFVVEQECVYLDPDDSDHSAIHVACIKDDQLAAYARLYEQKNMHIGRIIVSAPNRNKGVGSEVIRACLDYWKESSFECIEMSAQVYLSDYYVSFGFTPIGSMYLEDGIPHIRMIQHKSS